MTTENTIQDAIDLACDLGRKLNSMIDDVTAANIGRRIKTLSRATFIPDSGSGNIAACAFLTGMSEGGFYQSAHRRGIPSTKPGDELIYRFSDVVKTFEEVAPTNRRRKVGAK